MHIHTIIIKSNAVLTMMKHLIGSRLNELLLTQMQLLML